MSEVARGKGGGGEAARARARAHRFSASSRRWVSASSALRICSKCSWCAFIAASSSSSITSIIDCSNVLPTSTSRIGSTSASKSLFFMRL